MVELHHSGRSFAELSKEFGVTGWTIRYWVKQDARDRGQGDGGLTSGERDELVRLRRENRKLLQERDINLDRKSPVTSPRAQRNASGRIARRDKHSRTAAGVSRAPRSCGRHVQ
jgi:transposase